MKESNNSMDQLYEDLRSFFEGKPVLDVIAACLAILRNIPIRFDPEEGKEISKSIVSLLKMSVEMMESKDE